MSPPITLNNLILVLPHKNTLINKIGNEYGSGIFV